MHADKELGLDDDFCRTLRENLHVHLHIIKILSLTQIVPGKIRSFFFWFYGLFLLQDPES